MRTRSRNRRLWTALAILIGLGLLASLGVYFWLLADLPPLDDLHSYAAAPSSKIYDRQGRLLFEMPPPYSGRHSPIALSEVPEALQQAVVATEDATFYQNPGVDGWAILRAAWINLRGGEVLSGGSTLTQQLARNLLLSPDERYERTLTRKLREAVLAWRLDARYSKDQILELYLNETYYGNMAYGVEAAAQAYFGKPVRDLDLAECAMLAGLPQAPSYYNPLENLERAKERQAVVLDLMVKHGYLTAAEARRAKGEELYFAAAPLDIRAPHFVMYVRGLLEQALGLERLEQGGLDIYTTLDLDLNETARDLARYRLERLAGCSGRTGDCPPGGHNVRNAAVVALDPQTGEILAMLGSPDYFSARISGAVNGTTALRQPGSAIKPITYAAAFAQGELTPATVMIDERTAFVTKEGKPYVPLNYDLLFRGPVRLREALASSYNVIAVKVLDAIGVETMTNLARRMGITTFDEPERLGLAVTLGGGEVRLLELAAAYASFANGGYAVQPVAIRRVEDAEGRVLLAAPPEEERRERVLDERVAYLVSDILSDNMARMPSFGEGSALELSRPAAVKTGTTTDFRDNWTVGFTPGLVIGVWAGNADNEPMRDISGISGAAPLWHDLMEAALKGQPVREFPRPEGLVEVEVCAASGQLPGPDCPYRLTELFLEGTEPTEQLAIASTPSGDIAKSPPAEKPESKAQDRALALSSPDEGAVYRLDPALPRDAQRIEVAVSARAGAFLQEVTLLVDGRPLARLEAPPYRVLWRLEPGLHTFKAEATGGNGERLASNEVRIEVKE